MQTTTIELGILIVAIVGVWLDLRRESMGNRKEFVERFAKLETKLEPLWNWWNAGRK